MQEKTIKSTKNIENRQENEEIEVVESKQSLFERVSKLKDIERELKEVADYSELLLQEKGKEAYDIFIKCEEYANLFNQMLEIKNKAEGEVKNKVNGYVWLIKKIEKEQELYEERQKYFERKNKALKNQIENLKQNLIYNLTREGIEKLQTIDFGITIGVSRSIEIYDEKEIPFEFCKQKLEASKTLIKEYFVANDKTLLKSASGKIIAENKTNKNVRIK